MAGQVALDRYSVLQCLYEGDYTVIYTALHTVLGSQMALKVLRPDAPDEVAPALLQEGRIQAVVRHPHVLRVSDAFKHGSRTVVVMEFIKGESLADYLDHGPVAPELVLQIMRGITRGVRAIHKRGIVHRDLKPENILLEPNGKRFRPLIADFGLAKVLKPGKQPEPHGLSNSFSFLGTPEYMAPEQANDPGRVDTRADLFSLGAILYELLTGQVCFEETNEVDSLYRAAKGEYAPIQELAPHVSEELADMVAGLLEPRVANRTTSAGDLLRQLDRLPG